MARTAHIAASRQHKVTGLVTPYRAAQEALETVIKDAKRAYGRDGASGGVKALERAWHDWDIAALGPIELAIAVLAYRHELRITPGLPGAVRTLLELSFTDKKRAHDLGKVLVRLVDPAQNLRPRQRLQSRGAPYIAARSLLVGQVRR